MTGLTQVRRTGEELAEMWKQFTEEFPEALVTAQLYGSAVCKPIDEVTMALEAKAEFVPGRTTSSRSVGQRELGVRLPAAEWPMGCLAQEVWRPGEVHRHVGERRLPNGDGERDPNMRGFPGGR